ncbi:MAG: hypothetical protein QM796_15910 [Chthoniobacteraceae bacterium]
MINLLRSDLLESDIARILAQVPAGPILPGHGDPSWASAAHHPTVQQWLTPVGELASNELHDPFPGTGRRSLPGVFCHRRSGQFRATLLRAAAAAFPRGDLRPAG